MVKENLKYNEQNHVLNGPPTPGSAPAEGDLGFDTPQKTKDPVKAVKKTHKSRKAVQDFLGGDYLSKEWVTGNLSYILYVALLAMIYIANTYSTEKMFKTIERTKNELKELRYEYITTKSILMFQGRQSEISKRAVVLGLREAKMPPYKILYSGESLQPKKAEKP
ncbi:MAG: FtsL-like putative cell division protein [Bacteroidetes bacterium]|nr:FtsL-like putative cell division protein [Bacteroidota bacterium]